MTNQELGQKIKYFRTRAGMSQMDLEVAIGASPGSLSRIENGKVNPTRETIDRISLHLELNKTESSYLSGPLSHPATKFEIEEAIQSIHESFQSKQIYAYLLDDRHRFLAVSAGMKRMFTKVIPNTDQFVRSSLLGVSLQKIILSDELKISSILLHGPNANTLLTYQLARFYNEVGFMIGDKYYEEGLKAIIKHPLASHIWENVQKKDIETHTIRARTISFSFEPFTIELTYSREPLAVNPRFEVIDYTPTNRLLKFIAQNC